MDIKENSKTNVDNSLFVLSVLFPESISQLRFSVGYKDPSFKCLSHATSVLQYLYQSRAIRNHFMFISIDKFMYYKIFVLFEQVSASFILDFIHENEGYITIFAHGLSCGTYVWSEVLVKAAADMKKYESTLNKIKGQVFDSPPAPPPLFQKSFSVAVFPNNYILSLIVEYIIK